jgi:membrane protein DedA with SNARE-associated domain
MDQIQPYLDYFGNHPYWAIAVVFLIAMGEALLVIGLFVPSTAVLVGAGALVGTGKLDFWPIMIATSIGCIMGDQLSYWAGRMFGDRLRNLWPLKNYPHLLARGEAYVKSHGGISIALGRFVPGIKSVVPGIAGMFGMGQIFFLSVNIVSGIAWAALHLLPGVVLGQALALAGELSGRLLIVLLVLLAVLAVAGWLIRLIAASLSPYRKAAQGHISAWAKSKNSPTLQRFGSVIAPQNPNSVLLILMVAIGVAAAIALVDLVSGLVLRQAVSNFDHSLFNYFSELRSIPGDEIFVRVTMLGDEPVLLATAIVPVLWFAVRRNWRAAIATFMAVALAKLVLIGFSFGVPAPGFDVAKSAFKFPSGHALMSGTVLGILSVLGARGIGRWSQALVVAGGAMLVIAISFSRLYLGVNWFSDILGGILIASIIAVIYSVSIATIHMGRFKPLALLATSAAVMLIAGGINIQNNFDKKADRYQPINKILNYSQAEYLASGWSKVPGQRINFVGTASEAFVIQWVGSLSSLKDALARDHFKLWEKWGWRDALPYMNPNAALIDLAPRPTVHEGLKAKLNGTLDDPTHTPERIVLRAYQSNVKVVGTLSERVYLINITHENLKPKLGMFAVPNDEPIGADELAAVIKTLTDDPQIETLANNTLAGKPVVILKPKS